MQATLLRAPGEDILLRRSNSLRVAALKREEIGIPTTAGAGTGTGSTAAVKGTIV